MGCDIHAYVEYKSQYFAEEDDHPHYYLFADLCLRRNYRMFALMAGVRAYEGHEILYMPRGLPEHVDYRIMAQYTLYVALDVDEPSRECTPEEAERYIKAGWSKWWDEKHTRITHPDWHHASWLSASEFEQCLDAYGKRYGDVPLDYKATLDAMLSLGRGISRLVFWFDN